MPVLPYLLAFSAGAMIYVVVEELIPETQAGEHSNMGTMGFAIGFMLMMALDVLLGLPSETPDLIFASVKPKPGSDALLFHLQNNFIPLHEQIKQ